MVKKNWIWIALMILVVIIALVLVFRRQPQDLSLGAIMPLSGDLATYGKPVKEGMEFATEEVNANGGIGGRRLTLIYEDDAGKPTQAATSFQKLSDADKTPLILGPLTSGSSLATVTIANEKKVVQLSTIAGTIKLSGAGPYVFRLFPSDEFQGTYLGHVASEVFASKRAAIVYVNNAYGEGIRGVVKKAYAERGGQIVAEEAIAEGGTNFNSQIAKVKQAHPDLIFGLLYYNEGAQLLVQLKQQGLKTTVLGGDAWFGPIGGLAGDAADLLVFSSVAFGPEFKDSPKMQSFISAFKAKHGREPDSYNATGYDAVYAAKYAIEKSGASPDQIRDALHQVEFDGALGHVKFNDKGDNIGGVFALYKINGNKAVKYH